MNPLPPGSRIGRFEISGLLGEGAMGVVYLGHDPQIERPVAIKTLRPPGIGTAASDVESRFLKEAKLAGRLQHPNVVTIYEAGEDAGLLYIAMEYVDGESLTRYLASRQTLTLRERVEVVREVALALQHAHERGVLHRDVKPGNILLTRDRRVKVADFGIGKLLSGTQDLTRTGQMVGSPAYMSPEQIRGEKLDGRSDFFSLGVVFYELLTGTRPFPGDSITALVYQILHTEPLDPLAIRADLPPSTSELFVRLLAKSPERRPADAAEFLREVRRLADQLSEAEETADSPAVAATIPMTIPLPRSTVPAPPPPPPAVPAGPATASGAGEPAAATAGAPPRRAGGALFLFGLAAVIVAIALFMTTWRRSKVESETTATAPITPPGRAAGAPAPSGVPPPTVSPAPAEPGPTLGPLPTPGPPAAADAVVGATRYTGARPPRATPESRAAGPLVGPAEESSPEPAAREGSSGA
ncbi:MAG TPA: protein kinase, partial [Thermoanaerobaculia bacterium]|nr:protein kinase [Thermoanaerobaculia bacterium]